MLKKHPASGLFQPATVPGQQAAAGRGNPISGGQDLLFQLREEVTWNPNLGGLTDPYKLPELNGRIIHLLNISE